MNRDENKKVLFVIGMEQSSENLLKDKSNLDHDHMIVLQSYGAVLEPFSELMRDIILAVYEENVEEIFVAVPNVEVKSIRETIKKIVDNKELKEKIQTLDYLFQNCMPEYPNGSVRGWLEGNQASNNGTKSAAEVIRNHPLIPSNVKVTELSVGSINQAQMAVL
ncbi:hypothetical protein [Neobacillus dielmonensis]|uniref:hypothetical protein n=1 Tax=Neobacillus dielmonensis TaxID=1347369 RepID=UPI0005A6B3D7|nr:hypothetical protein [Neobacillus dielmonensis]